MSESVAEFLNMGGYAFYVWGSFGLVVVVMMVNSLLPGIEGRVMIRRLRREILAAELDGGEGIGGGTHAPGT